MIIQKINIISEGTVDRYLLPEYNRIVDVNLTLFGGKRFCLTAEDTFEVYELNWCMGKQDLTSKVFEVIEYALSHDIELPFCSNIKPLYNDEKFLYKIKTLTGIYLIEQSVSVL